MIIASIVTPNWVTYSVTTPKGERFEKHIGLHRSCSSLDSPPCRDFPPAELCQDGERYFCSMWRTIGFMASLATILCLACLVTFGVIMRGGKYKRETGWPVVSGILALVAIVEFVIISIVVRVIGSGSTSVREPLLIMSYRRTCSITTTSSRSQDGASISLGT